MNDFIKFKLFPSLVRIWPWIRIPLIGFTTGIILSETGNLKLIKYHLMIAYDLSNLVGPGLSVHLNEFLNLS
jgi:hypothetical protein